MRSFVRSCVLVLVLLAPLAASAAAPGSYAGEAPVASQSDADRAAALRAAMANAIAAQSADPAALSRPEIARAVAQADRYVLQYEYRHGGDGFVLVAQFDSAVIDRLLQRDAGGDAAAAAGDTPSQALAWVGGIRGADDYVRLMAYFARNHFVRSAQPVAAQGDGLLVRLSLASDLPRFLEVVAMERTLAVAGAPAPIDGAEASLVLTP